MEQQGMAFHETIDLHEMVNLKTLCVLKSKLMQGVCFDSDLKAMLNKDVELSVRQLNELLQLYKGGRTF